MAAAHMEAADVAHWGLHGPYVFEEELLCALLTQFLA
jgi:hypothetical protein